MKFDDLATKLNPLITNIIKTKTVSRETKKGKGL